LAPEDYDDPRRGRLKSFVRGVGHPLAEQYLRWTYYFSEEQKRSLLAPLAARLPQMAPSSRRLEERFDTARGISDPRNRVQYVDLETFLADNILQYTDRTSMAVSLEVRVPFLDPRIVAWSFGRPFREKLTGGVSKRILRSTFADVIPEENLSAPK